MVSVFSKNAILVGEVDYFCLVCETHLKNDRDSAKHISKPGHQTQLEAIQYVAQFKAEGIKKIKQKYFCEVCNKLLTVIAKVRLHITEQSHVDNKNKNFLKRMCNYVVAFDKVAISDQSWNGLSENSCAICNIEYEKEEIHTKQLTHILNIVQIHVDVDNNQNIYRKTDEYSFHCLTCNTVLGLKSLTSHFGGDEHQKLYQECCDAYNNIPLNIHTENNLHNDTIKPKGIIKDSTTEAENIQTDDPENIKKDDTITSETFKIEASKNRSVPIGNDKPNFKNTSQLEENNVNRLSAQTNENSKIYEYVENDEENICERLLCKNYVYCNSNVKYCILCDSVLYDSVERHTASRHHQTIYRLHKKRLQKAKNSITSGSNKYDSQNVKTIHVISNDILAKLDEFQKGDIEINFESNTVYCKKCKTHIEFACDLIENHILKHKENENKSLGLKYSDKNNTSFTSLPVNIKQKKKKGNKHEGSDKNDVPLNKDNTKEAKNDGKNMFPSGTDKNDVPVNKDDTKEAKNDGKSMFPSGSDKNDVPVNKDDTKEAKNDGKNMFPSKTIMPSVTLSPANEESKKVKSTNLTSNLKSKKPKAVTLNKVPSHIFVQSISFVNHLMYSDVIINQKYCINFMSFCSIVKLSKNVFRCELCDLSVQLENIPEHLNLMKHSEGMTYVYCILNDESEFIRELRSECFQCSYCNRVETSWEDMQGHLKNTLHKEMKLSATWRREMYKLQIDNSEFNFDRLSSNSELMAAVINQYL